MKWKMHSCTRLTMYKEPILRLLYPSFKSIKTILPDNSPKCCTLTFIRCKVIPPMIVADGSSNKSTNPKTLHENENAQSHKIYHVQRANYQAGIRRKCLTNSSDLPDPQSCGWLIEKHVLHVM